jgi:replicative DNA helicase
MESEKSSRIRFEPKHRSITHFDLSTQLGKVPPQALELEEAVLGALMLEKDALSQVIEILKPEIFYKDAHREIYAAIKDLFENSEPVDILTVTNKLRKNGKLEFVGGAYYIAGLTSRVNSSANIEYHSRLITEMAIKRELIRISSEIQRDAFEDSTDVFELLDKAEQSLFDVSETNIRKNFDNMRSLMNDAIKELEFKKNQKDGLTGIPSGFTALDRITSGWQKSDLVIIAARPGMGKTALVLSALRNAAVEFDRPVAIFSLEMSAVQLVNRLISAEAELEGDKIKKGNLEDYEWEQLVYKTSKLTEAPIFIDDTPALSILELRAKARRLVSQHQVQLIVVDYLQLMTGDRSKGASTGNREQEIASISRALKNIAKELSVPVIAISQLSRAVETRGGDKRPLLSDLRESGSIEQDADMVLFLYRPEYYGITEDESGISTKGLGEVSIAKHRNGSTGTVNLKFIGHLTKFVDLDSAFENQDSRGSGGAGNRGYVTFKSRLNIPDDKDKLSGKDLPGDEAPF